MTYDELRIKSNSGWNTWYSPSMTSHALLPYGFCIGLSFKDFADSKVIRDLKVGDHGLRPGPRSWDGSYTSLAFSAGKTEITVESAAKDGEQYILVSPKGSSVRDPELIIEASLLWGKEGVLFSRDGRIGAEFPDGKKIEIYTTGEKDPRYVYPSAKCPYFPVALSGPVAVSTVPASVEDVRALLCEAKARVTDEEAEYGENAGAYQAMRSCLAWDTIYEPEHDRICSPVSRSWSEGWGGYVLFDWDTYFAALMSQFGSRELAYLNAFAITNEVTEEGFVPNFGSSDDNKSRDRSQPPVGSLVALRLWERFRDDWFVKEIFPTLYRWNTWFREHRTLPDGTMCWGSERFSPRNGRYFEINDISNLQGAKFESGLDNSPMYDDAKFDSDKQIMLLSDVGLTGLYIMDCRCLIKLAGIAGENDSIPILKERLDLAESAMETLWNGETGIYENRDAVTGRSSHRISPTNLYSLFSHRVSEDRKRSMSQRYLCDPEELGGEFMLPSISRRDPAFPDQDYWRGRIWAPMNYLVYEALCEAGMKDERKLLAQSSRAVLLKEWTEHGHVHENYSGYDGQGCDKPNSNNFYHWGGLLGYIAVKEASNN
ncbi:MAG: hypothetical protein K6D94_03425 [Clostridiales bacterium]|nr:hypothetical protein [Clostridiales bacterium]